MKPAGTEHEVVQIGQVARHEKAPRSDRRGCPFRKFHPGWIRVVRQNHRIIRIDVRDPALARNVRRGLVQAVVPA